MRRSVRELEDMGVVQNFATSRFNSISCIVSKVKKNHCGVEWIKMEVLEKVKKWFGNVIPWSRNIKKLS